MRVAFAVLGPVTAVDDDGRVLALKGPRHREVLARLIVARRRVVPVTHLVEDLWTDPPVDGVGAVRTFVAALRRALEPGRAPRAAPRLLITEGSGYALRAAPDSVDAWRFERRVADAATQPAAVALAHLDEALEWWNGPAYTGFEDAPWARAERARLAELRLRAVELRASAHVDLGLAAEAVADLDAHVEEHPWREDAWRLLALALYRSHRQGDALAVLRRARTLLAQDLGLEPGPALRRLEADILDQAPHLDPDLDPDGGARNLGPESVWSRTTAAYDRTVGTGAKARLESTVGLLRSLAVTGGEGLTTARRHRVAAIVAAEETGDAELTARVIGAYDVPAIWTRVDDPEQSAFVVAAAERTLRALPADAHDAVRARLLTTIAVESRGARGARGPEAAHEAERIARRLGDPVPLAFALDGVFLQTFGHTGLAPRRDEIGAELIALSTRHDLATFEVTGHLIRLQARSALADFAAADRHARAADGLAERHERPLVGVFTAWYRALRLAETTAAPPADVERAYRDAAARLDGAGMPGLEHGLLPLALLCLCVRDDRPADFDDDTDWGPYRPWARPLVLSARGRRSEAAAALRRTPRPPHDLLAEALWCLTARAAVVLDDLDAMARAHEALTPAASESGGGGVLTVGPVARYLDEITTARDGRRDG